ncbi:hotdog fold thioesterase [bacterium]|nr:hotdog fold thioesterase [bacterium]
MSQSYDPAALKRMQLVDHNINDTLGIEFTEIRDGYVRGTMPVNEHTVQPYGILHGGASIVLAESLGSLGAAVLVMAEGKQAVGIEVNANHLRPVEAGDTVTGEAKIVHQSRTLQVWQIDLSDSQGRKTCTCRLTCAVRDAR